MVTCSRLIKSMLGSVLFLIALFSLSGCGDSQSVDSNVALAQMTPVAPSTKENDKQFLVRAVEMKYEQILLGKLGQQRSGIEEIRTLAKMLEDANREAKSSLASLGIVKSISVPSAPTQLAIDSYDKLNEATIEEFDFAYINHIIQTHNDAINLFENAAHGNFDKDIQAKALAMIPDMRNYLSKAMEINSHLNPMSELVK